MGLATNQATALLERLPPLARTMTGIAMRTGLQHGELFAMHWKAVDLIDGHLTVKDAGGREA